MCSLHYPGPIDRPNQIIEDASAGARPALRKALGLQTADSWEMEATVFREQMINFLEAAVVFLLVTNALSIAATTWAIQLLNGFRDAKQEHGITERKLKAIVQRAC